MSKTIHVKIDLGDYTFTNDLTLDEEKWNDIVDGLAEEFENYLEDREENEEEPAPEVDPTISGYLDGLGHDYDVTPEQSYIAAGLCDRGITLADILNWGQLLPDMINSMKKDLIDENITDSTEYKTLCEITDPEDAVFNNPVLVIHGGFPVDMLDAVYEKIKNE